MLIISKNIVQNGCYDEINNKYIICIITYYINGINILRIYSFYDFNMI